MPHSNTPTVRNRASLTARNSSLRYIGSRAPHCRTVLQNRQDKTKEVSQEVIYYGTLLRTSSRYQVFEKLLYRKQENIFSKVSLESNVTPNLTWSSDSFSTVPSIVNGGDWGCIVRNLETIIDLVLLAFNLIPQRSHHSLTLQGHGSGTLLL